MKKNKALTAAISVLSLTMVSLCAIGGTFAKYTSQDSDFDTATVAKWGVTVDVAVPTDGTKLNTNYNNDNGVTPAFVSVESSTSVNVVAPGTEGTIIKVSVTGNPEVSVDISQVATVTFSGDWTIDNDEDPANEEKFYCPIVFAVNGEPVDTSSVTDAASLAAAIKAELDYSTEKAPNVGVGYTTTLTWEWAFDGEDAFDTLLGNNASGANVPGFRVDVSTIVTQVD